ncbi:MAG: TolB family protein [Janthinobacterium lividum]
MLALLCLPGASAYSQTTIQHLGQFQGQGDLGTILHPGSGRYDDSKESYTVSGSGANLWFGIDDFHFVWKKMSGDVALSADIDFVGEKGNAHRKAVLMIRQSLDPHSVYADVARHGDGLTSLQYRDATGADTHEIETYGKGPHRVRIEKRGNYAYVSIPDHNGNLVPSGAAIRVDIKGDYYVGLGICSHDENITETAVFSNVSIEPLATSTGQPVLHSTLESVIVASTDRRVRYTAPAHFEDPNWTPDGKALIFNQDGTLQRFELDNGVHPIDSTVARSTLSTKIPLTPDLRVNGDHGISPDGSLIAVGGAGPDGQANIYVMPITGGAARRVTSTSPAYFHGWSPDGKALSFTGQHGDVFDAYTVPVAGGLETRLAPKSDVAEFSPDGQWIYFQSDRTGHMQIWRMHPDGSAQEQLLVSETSDWFPHISPNGKLIAYLAYEAGTQGHPANLDVEIRVLSVSDRKVRTLAKLLGGRGSMNVPSWSPDSKMLAFTSFELLPR